MYNEGIVLMDWVIGNPSNVEEMRFFLRKVEEIIREDERKKIASFIESLGSRLNIEIQAYVENLSGESKDSPLQIKLNV